MATIRDVAAMAGVSIATVSNYLNSSKPVSTEVARKIKDAVETLHYTQNISAKSLRKRSYYEVGVVLPNFDDPYYVQIFKGIENAFQNSHYFVNVAFSYDIPQLEQSCIKDLLSKQICGLLIISCQPDAQKYFYENFTSQGRPVVMIDRLIDELDASFASLDNFKTIYSITKSLLSQKNTNLYLFSGPRKYSCEANCIRGFHQAFLDAGLEVEPFRLIETYIEKEHAFTNAIRLLKDCQSTTILTTSSLIADGIIEACHLLGLSEKDVPVITLGEEHWNCRTQSFAAHSTPRPAIRLGVTAASMLINQISFPLRESEYIIMDDSSVPSHSFSTITCENTLDSTDTLRVLMLKNPAMHTFQGLVRNYEKIYCRHVNFTFLPHRNMLHEIQHHSNKYDVIMYDIPWLPTLAFSGILHDITELLNTIDTSAFIPDCLQNFGYFRNRCYGIPFMYAPQILYYRKDLFENTHLSAAFEKQYNVRLRPPITLKEFNAIAEFFSHKTDAIDYGFSIPAAYNECFAPEIYFRLQAYGSQIFGPRGKATFNNPQTFQSYINLGRAIRFAKPNYMEATDNSVVSDFFNGETAMLITYPAFLSEVADLRKCGLPIDYSLVPGRTPILGGWGLGIPISSNNKPAAFSFLRWACEKEISNYFTIMGGQTAISSTYTNDEMVKLYPWLPLYYKNHAYAQLSPSPTLENGMPLPSAQIDDILCKWAYEFIHERISVQEAISNTQGELERFVSSVRRSYV